MSFQQYNVYDGLTACRVVATTNQTGTYINGPLNNGVGATFTYATGVLTIDSVVVVLGDSVALVGQTNGWENGIYICTQTGAVGVSAVLQRRGDFQCIEQLKTGQFCTIGAGTVSAGSEFVLVEPLPQQFGIDSIVFTAAIPAGSGTASTKAASDNTKPTVASVGSAVVVGTIAHFVDTSGTIDDTAGTVINQGPIQSGSSGVQGSFTAFPATAANGFLELLPINAGGAFNTIISNSVMGQTSTISIPDPGAATSKFVLSQSIAPTNNVSFTKVITAGFAALGTAGKIVVVAHPTATSQFAVLDIKVLTSTGLSGGGGNRLLAVSDGTIVFNNAGITAALLGTPIFTLWGGTGNPVAIGAAQVSTAGADIFLQYTGGTTDYTAGSVQVAITLVQVTA